VALCLGFSSLGGQASAQPRALRASSVSPRLRETSDLGRAGRTEEHHVVLGLALRNREALETYLAEVQDPASPLYHRFLTQEEFNASYAPTVAEEAAFVAHLASNGLDVTERASNRLLVGATGSVAALEQALGVEMHAVRFRGARHYAAINEPSLPTDLASVVAGVVGLDDLAERRAHRRPPVPILAPSAALGSNCCHLSPNDVATFYDDARVYDGTGQTLIVAGAYAWKDTDNTAFNTQWVLPQLPAGSAQVCTGTTTARGCKFSSSQSIEIALDVEYAHAVAPGARVLNYMAASIANADFTTMYNRIVTDNPGHVVSTSWGSCEAGLTVAEQQMDDNVFANANAIGQSWFAASGDDGSRDCGDNSTVSVDNPANSPHVIGVGGTTPVCKAGLEPSSPACSGYGSETAWNGSGGGVSQVFARPSFQVGCGVPAGTRRLVPDVALEADTSPGNYVREGGNWYSVGGTSDAAPQWAGYFTVMTQKAGGGGLGNPGALLYSKCGTAAYHDVKSGSNGDYTASAGYDMVTGLGTIDADQFLGLGGSVTTTTATTTLPGSTTTTTLPGCGATAESSCQPARSGDSSLVVSSGSEKLTWKWTSSGTVTATDLGTPSTSTDYVLCLYDAAGLRSGGQAPAGGICGTRPCWKAFGSGVFKYSDREGTPDGLTSILLRPGDPGRARIHVSGKGANLEVPSLPLATPVKVQLKRVDGTACWEATYSTAIRNDTSGFKARSD